MNNSQAKINTLPAKLKAERPMPKWVTEANERIGPKPPAPPPTTTNGTPRPPALPPKKNQPEPDYEVIEFSGQQYSNEPTIVMRPKTPDTRRPESAMKCTLCGSNNPWVTCDECAQQIFCASCDDMFHKHPKRKTHLRKAIELKRGSTPLIPPKAAQNPAPVAPPRRNKKGMPSPMPLRRDQVIGSAATTPTSSPVPGQQQQAWQDRLGSLKRGLNLSSRPLPETPRTPSDGVSSRSTTPNSKSVFDTIQRPPSITLEKIKNKASATLDRMALLQQRYRQHKEGKLNDKPNGPMGNSRDQNLPIDQWSNISSPSHFRSGSMSSGINSFDFPDDSPFHFQQQMGMRNGSAARNMSTSVFNLNQVSQRPTEHHSPMWMGGSQMHQAQSMAQLNCINCSNQRGWNQPHHHPDEWPGASNSNLNRSNMSLNVPHGYYPGSHMMHPPPVFMNMPGMYPYPMGVGMPAMNPGLMGMPSTARSRATSRAGSRVPSPTLSRKSMQVRKKRTNYTENELTDDEDSDNDDRRSLMSQRSGLASQRRTRRVSSASQALPLEEEEEPRTLRSKILTSRDRRAPSIPKSVQSEWTPARRTSASSNTTTNFNSYKKVYSDSPISPDSEASEAPPPARALVQAKIEEKLKESAKPKLQTKPIAPASDEDNHVDSKNPFDEPETADDNQYQNTDDLKLSEEQAEKIIAEDSPSLGPPPSTPEHEWECEFCTFVNEAKTKICSICCKTPQRSPPKVEATSTTTPAKVSNITNGIAKTKLQPSEDVEPKPLTKKKDNDSVEDIWATLDENIQAEASKAKRNAETNTASKKRDTNRAPSVTKEKKPAAQKVSTGCGPSPPKEIKKELRSTATSPVPQSISTQTYDCLPGRTAEIDQDTQETSTQMASTDIQSQSFTPPTRNFSPKEMYPPIHDRASSREAENFATLERNLRFYRDMSITQGDRYRSSNDIRLDELPPSVIQSRPSVSDYLSMQKAQMYHNDNFFDQYAASKRNEPTRDPEIELFMMLKEAEHYKFTAEELHAALKHCGDTHPIVWLRENWSKLVQTVQSLATKYGQERIENVIGTISAIEAREALRIHGGNVWQAISECVEQRQRKYLEISAKGNYSREDIVTALTAHHGNMELALLDLSKTQLKPFLMRVWGSPGGVENESANYLPPPPKTEVSSPIHEFLTANADQIPFTQDQAHFRHASSSVSNLPASYMHDGKDDTFVASNNNVLKDLETLIGNMEQVQAKQNGQILRSIEDMLGNLLAKRPVEAEIDLESERIFMKSPILSQRSMGASNKATDVKNFVWQHIQEIVPNLVEQVEKELLEPHDDEEDHPVQSPPVPIDPDMFIMEEVIRPNLKHSTEVEEAQVEMQEASPIADFKAETDRGSPKKQKEELKLNSFANAPRAVFKSAVAPESSEEETSEEESSEEESSEDSDSQGEEAAKPTSAKEENGEETPAGNLKEKEVEAEPVIQQEQQKVGVQQGTTEQPIQALVEQPGQQTAGVQQGVTEKSEEKNAISHENQAEEPKQVQGLATTTEELASEPTNTETQEEPLESDTANDETESNANKSWGFKGFSLRIGFNSLRRSRRQRSRRSIKREKRSIDNENAPQPSESNKQKENEAPVELKDDQNNVTLSNEQEPVPPSTSDQSATEASALNTASVEEAENIEPAPQEQIILEPTPAKSNKKRRVSHIPSLKYVKQDQTSGEPSSQKSEELAAENTPLSSTTSSAKNKEPKNQEPPTKEIKSASQKIEVNEGTSDNQASSSGQQLKEPDVEGDRAPTGSTSTQKAVEKKNIFSTSLKKRKPQAPPAKQKNRKGNSKERSAEPSAILVEANNTLKENETVVQNPEEPTESLTKTNQAPKKEQTSRIPIRRYVSTTSLKSIPSTPTDTTPLADETPSQPLFESEQPPLKDDAKPSPTDDEEFYEDIQSSSEEEEPDFFNVVEEVVQPNVPPPRIETLLPNDDGETSDQELYSVGSDETRDLMQSPTSESEVLLIIGNDQPLPTTSSSTRTITPMSSKSIDFKYSDPSKQNLSELVEDTQRLIKQMKEEINIDMAAFDSEDDYSEDYSYEEYEEEYDEEEEDDADNGNGSEEEESEHDETYSNVELESEADEVQENEGSLQDLEEVDEIEYIDVDDQDSTETSQPPESLPVALNHKPSTDHSPSIVVESSISNESLTNPTHLAIDEHITVSVIPGLLPPEPSPAGDVVQEQIKNKILKPKVGQLKPKEANKPAGAQNVEMVEQEPGPSRALPKKVEKVSQKNEVQEEPKGSISLPAEPVERSETKRPKAKVSEKVDSVATRVLENDVVEESKVSVSLPKEPVDKTEIKRSEDEVADSAITREEPGNSSSPPTKPPVQVEVEWSEEPTTSKGNSNTLTIEPTVQLEGERSEEPTTSQGNLNTHPTEPTVQVDGERSEVPLEKSENSRPVGKQTTLKKELERPADNHVKIANHQQSRESSRASVSPRKEPVKLSQTETVENKAGSSKDPEESRGNLIPLLEHPIIPNETESPMEQINNNLQEESAANPSTESTELSISSIDTEIFVPNQPDVSSDVEPLEATPQPTTSQSVNIDIPSSSNSGQSTPNQKRPVFASQIDIVLENASRTSISPVPADTSPTTSNDDSSQLVTALTELLHTEQMESRPAAPQTFPNNVDVQTRSQTGTQLTDAPSTSSTQTKADDVPSTSKDSSPRKSPPNKSASKIPKPKGSGKPTSIPTRSKSFSGPSPIGISSVRAIQQELFNKQSQLAKPTTAPQKLQPPTVVRKKSITDAISKFTQATAQHAVQRSRTQPKIPKIPKKKYHETCFSDDDYQETTSEDEAPQPAEVRLRKQSAPVFRTYPSIQEPIIEKPEVLARRLIDEQLVTNMAEAQIAAALVGKKFQQDVSIWAAKECCDLDQAISLLQQDCELCMGSYPMNQIVSMLKCTHKCCKECAKNYFTIQITDRSINDCNCPYCKIPELHDPDVHEDENLEYFSNLDIFLKNILEPEVHELFQRKLRDRTLVQDPNFKWCIQCSSGFFARPKQKRLICPDCGSVTCSQCRKTWEKQHEGLSCEKFQEWKEANDPEIQAKGVADHLATNGIDCPKCRFKYSLARGGCMHFTCTQCKFEFCFGCSKPFMMGAKCGVSPYCSKLGLHAHHPRSCLFYLRDKNPLQLQNLLKQNNVAYDVDPVPQDQTDGASSTSKCPIPLQKETPKGLVDTVCNADVQQNHAGLCRQHYVEYLAAKVAKSGIDPLPILDLTDCVQELRRRGLPLPERGPWDTDDIYRNMCSKVIKENIPIE